MKQPLKYILDLIATHFKDDPAKMLIGTGVAGWTISSIAQITAIVFNPKIDKRQKSFLVPQEFADAAMNIGSFFLITQGAKKYASKLFTTGKFAPKTVREFLNKSEIYKNKVGKIDFNIDEIKSLSSFPKKEYESYKKIGTTVATVGGGIIASNVVTPIVRNNMAAKMQRKYIKNHNELDKQNTLLPPKSSNLRV